MNKRIILIGPAASGKDYLRHKFRKQGFKIDCSYTTRPIRDGEIEGETYHYISKDEFIKKQKENGFYEDVKHGKHFYGTGQWEWDNCDVFIMETDGVNLIKEEDRKNCFVIYLNPPPDIRMQRLREERDWDDKTIEQRIITDNEKFVNFTNYDLVIENPHF